MRDRDNPHIKLSSDAMLRDIQRQLNRIEQKLDSLIAAQPPKTEADLQPDPPSPKP
jgi:hypothetical protein